MLFLASSISAQESDYTNAESTLPAIAVQSRSFGELDLSRSKLLGEKIIESRKINSLSDLNGISTNLNLSGNGLKSFGDVLSIRGIGNTQLFGSPGVQMYIDGVPQGKVFSYGSDLFGIKNIEIFKGPQISQFGKLAAGGAINLISKNPSKSKINNLTVSYSTFNSQKYSLESSGPINSQFSYSLVGERSKTDGFLNNSSGQNNHADSWNGRINLNWEDGSGTKATLGASVVSHDLGAQPMVLRNQSDFYSRSVNELNEKTDIEQNQQFLKLENELGFGTLS